MPALRWVLAVGILAGHASLAAADEPDKKQKDWRLSPICGVWDGDQLFAAYTPDYNPNSHTAYFLRGNTDQADAKDASMRVGVSYLMPTEEMRHGTCKVTVAHDHLWVAAPGCQEFHVLPVEDLQYFECTDWSNRLLTKKLGRKPDNQWHLRYAYSVQPMLFRPAPGESTSTATPLPDARSFGSGEPLSPEQQQSQYVRFDACYDLVPTGDKSFVLFHLNTKFLEFEELTLKPPKEKGDVGTVEKADPKKQKGSIEVQWKGEFWAYQVGEVYYVLTHDGALHVVRPVDEPADKNGIVQWEMKTVWDDKKRPLVGAVQDLAGKRLLVFGRDGPGKDGKRFAFECDGSLKPTVKEYKTTAHPTDGFRETQTCVANFVKAPAKR
jgi:hypothetical protein